jgi:hypothetical protein
MYAEIVTDITTRNSERQCYSQFIKMMQFENVRSIKVQSRIYTRFHKKNIGFQNNLLTDLVYF